MISAREASLAIYGAWRLARLDAGGLQFFDNSVEGFWRSFWAAVVVLPAYVILILLRLSETRVAAGPLTVLVVESIAYVIGWFAFPFAMYYVTRAFDRFEWYCRYIAAYNWATVLQIAVFLGAGAVAASGLLPPAGAALLTMTTTFAILAYQWFIARVALEATVAGATAIVLLDLVLSLLLAGYTGRLLGTEPLAG